MRIHNRHQFGNRLVILTVTVCSIAVVLACLSFIVFQLTQLRPRAYNKAQVMAMMIANQCFIPLSLEDKNALNDTLNTLKMVPEIEQVRVKRIDESIFMQYTSSTAQKDHVQVSEDTFTQIVVKMPIMRYHQTLGVLELHYDLKSALHNLIHEVLIVFLIGLMAVVISALVALKMHNRLIKPVHDLTQAAYDVSNTGNYAVRIEQPGGDDEVGLLIGVFNSMLDKVQHAHDELEQRVNERTEQLNEALETAMAANQAKSLFLANMSHEIRTPMTAILGFADMLQETDLPETERVCHLQTIERNGKHLLAIINDILDLSKIEADQMQVEHINTNTLDILHDVQSLMQVKAIEKQLKLEVYVQAPFPREICSDPIRIRQVLVNLLSNAVKFTSKGSITLTAKLSDPAHPMQSKIALEVRDTGIGMTAEQVGKIFKPFTQADESTTRRFGGTGLGLTISHKLAKLLGGDLSASSVPGQGSVFTFTVENNLKNPAQMIQTSGTLGQLLTREINATTEPDVAHPGEPTLTDARILMVEDGIDNQKLISMLLKRDGAIVTLANNGLIALDKIEQAMTQNQPFDVVLMDMQMPVMDGYAATRQLRRNGYARPIIALTANAMQQDREACIKAGCDDFLSKPINKKTLLKTVRQFVHGTQSTDEQAA